MSETLRHAIRDGRMISDARREFKRAERDGVDTANAGQLAAWRRLDHAAADLNAGRIPAGAIVCSRGRR